MWRQHAPPEHWFLSKELRATTPLPNKYIYLNFSPPWKHEISMVHALHVRCYTGVLDSWSKVCRILYNVGCAVTIEVTFFWYITPGGRGTSMILS
jgi:hypothetical protein